MKKYIDERYVCRDLTNFVLQNHDFVEDSPLAPIVMFMADDVNVDDGYEFKFCPFCGKKIVSKWVDVINQQVWNEEQ